MAAIALLIAVTKVVVLTVSGPAFIETQGQKTSLRPQLDYAEASLVRGLRAKGLAVISLADSKNFAGPNWPAAYANMLREKAKSETQSASSNTLLLREQSPFRRTAGELAREMGADRVVLLTISPRMEGARLVELVQMTVIDQAGQCVFSEQVRMEAKGINEATEQGINKLLDSYSGRR